MFSLDKISLCGKLNFKTRNCEIMQNSSRLYTIKKKWSMHTGGQLLYMNDPIIYNHSYKTISIYVWIRRRFDLFLDLMLKKQRIINHIVIIGLIACSMIWPNIVHIYIVIFFMDMIIICVKYRMTAHVQVEKITHMHVSNI